MARPPPHYAVSSDMPLAAADGCSVGIDTLARIAAAQWQHARSTSDHEGHTGRRTSENEDDFGFSSRHNIHSTAASTTPHSAPPRPPRRSSDQVASSHTRNDRRASKACEACRARKTRCDAVRPSCGYCSKVGIDCHYVDYDLRKERFSKRRRTNLKGDGRERSVQPSSPPRSSSSPSPPRSSVPEEDASVEPDHFIDMADEEPAGSAISSSNRRPMSDQHQPQRQHQNRGSQIECHSAQTSNALITRTVSPSTHLLSEDLIEALSGKVAWFDELESNSATSQVDGTNTHSAVPPQPPWSNAAEVAALDPMLADLLQPSSIARTSSGKERIIQLHYFRSFGGATAVTQGLKKISVRIRVPPELEAMIYEAQNRNSLLNLASSGLDPQSLNLQSLLGTSRMLSGHTGASPTQPSILFANGQPGQDAWTPSSVSTSAGLYEDLPEASVRDLLLKRFFLRMSDHFPFLNQTALETVLASGKPVNPALVHAMCALAARFVEPHEADLTSPTAAATASTQGQPRSDKPYARGLPFAERAKSYMMSSITCPSVTTVATLVLLAWHEFAVNSEGGLWMFAGMSVRMSIDLGLHRKTKKNWFQTASSASDNGDAGDLIRRQPLFWCVFILDRLLSIGTGRPTTLKDQEINLDYPSLTRWPNAEHGGDRAPRPSVFGYLTRLMQKAGALAEIANNLSDEDDHAPLDELDKLESDMIADYDNMPPELFLGEEQLRASDEPRNLLSLHLWFHNLLLLMNRLPLSRLRANPIGSEESHEILRHASQQIRNAVLYANAVDLTIHLACPFANQAFCLAGCVEVAMAAALQQQQQRNGSHNRQSSNGSGMRTPRGSAAPRRSALSLLSGKRAQALFVQAHVDAYQRCVDALERLTENWLGVSWIANALKARKMEEGGESGHAGGGGGGAGSSGETMLSHSELKVLLRLAASTVSSTEQPISIVDDQPSSMRAGPSWTLNGATASERGTSHQASSFASDADSLPAVSSHEDFSGIGAPAVSTSFSGPAGPSTLQHLSISDVSHPDDLSHFLPFLSHPLGSFPSHAP